MTIYGHEEAVRLVDVERRLGGQMVKMAAFIYTFLMMFSSLQASQGIPQQSCCIREKKLQIHFLPESSGT